MPLKQVLEQALALPKVFAALLGSPKVGELCLGRGELQGYYVHVSYVSYDENGRIGHVRLRAIDQTTRPYAILGLGPASGAWESISTQESPSHDYVCISPESNAYPQAKDLLARALVL